MNRPSRKYYNAALGIWYISLIPQVVFGIYRWYTKHLEFQFTGKTESDASEFNWYYFGIFLGVLAGIGISFLVVLMFRFVWEENLKKYNEFWKAKSPEFKKQIIALDKLYESRIVSSEEYYEKHFSLSMEIELKKRKTLLKEAFENGAITEEEFDAKMRTF